MASPTPARWIAPAALLAALLAVALVWSSSTGDGEPSGSAPAATEGTATGSRTTARTSTRRERPRPRTTGTTTTAVGDSYTVQSGDTLGSIATRTGTTVEELQRLNPGVDSQSLSVGQELRLSG